MKRSSVVGSAMVLMASFLMLGCGGDASESTSGQTAASSGNASAGGATGGAASASGSNVPAQMQAFADDGNVAEIVIEGSDLIRYSIDSFSVEPGQMVRITLNHVGSLPAQAMGHNVVVLQMGEDVFEFGADVGQQGGSAANDFVPESLRDRVIAFTSMIGGGQSATVEFQAPQEPGEYPFLCSFPGHFGQMNGIMTVG